MEPLQNGVNNPRPFHEWNTIIVGGAGVLSSQKYIRIEGVVPVRLLPPGSSPFHISEWVSIQAFATPANAGELIDIL
jgi:hypothetical protein